MSIIVYFSIAIFIWICMTAVIVKLHKMKIEMFEHADLLFLPVFLGSILCAVWPVSLVILAIAGIAYGVFRFFMKVIP